MARCYSDCVPFRHPSLPADLPDIWLVTDERNDAVLAAAIKRLPRGSGVIFRHYHLDPAQRRALFRSLAREARRRGHKVFLSGNMRQTRRWRADGAYGPPGSLTGGAAGMRLVTAHSLREIGQAHRARANAILLSSVFPTRSHPRAKSLGPLRFRLLAAYAKVPVIALGGMTKRRSHAVDWKKWAAIDGIYGQASPWIPKDS
ncbi:MAG: thiamine phosphate synthase [Novosphingobium sp.]|nr:thiamine phosphate synthase [Novosphingobium sp.]